MKFIKKNIYWILCTMVLCAILIFTFSKIHPTPSRFLVNNEHGSQEISIYDAPNGHCYVFLPSYTDLKHVSVVLPARKTVTIGGIELSDGMNCGAFEFETDYTFQDDQHQETTLRFYRTQNVATLYIDTVSHTMDNIHSDKNVEETASITLYTADGQINYADSYSTLSGRGNTTWNYNKKPYVLKLSNAASLLGMGAETDWVLLANAADSSNLYNRIVYYLAAQTGFEWSPKGEYIDVYLNGEYNGLYLLSEKVESSESRLVLDFDSGDFWGEYGQRNKELSYSTATPTGRWMTIYDPKGLTSDEQQRCSQLLAQMEQEILSGADLAKSSIIDLDSWVRKYIVDEIAANVDSDRASCFFYYTDGKFHAGPIWDYDKGFGNCVTSRNPYSFVANNRQRSVVYSLPYYPLLYSNPSFQTRVKEIYETEFLPVLMQLTDKGIYQYAETLSAAIQADTIRWEGLTPALSSSALIPTDWTTLQDYLTKKTAFLTSAWIAGVDYCTVQFELSAGAEFANYSVVKGNCLEAKDVDLENTVWVVLDTGKIFDPSEPIERDLILVLQRQNDEASAVTTGKSPIPTNIVVGILSVGVLFILLVYFIVIERSRNTKRRRQ